MSVSLKSVCQLLVTLLECFRFTQAEVPVQSGFALSLSNYDLCCPAAKCGHLLSSTCLSLPPTPSTLLNRIMVWVRIFTLVCAVFIGARAQDDSLLVTVDAGELGKVTGLQLWTSQTLRPFYTFHGIPYAESTAGEGRFKVLNYIVSHLPSAVLILRNVLQPSVLRERPLEDGDNAFLALDQIGRASCRERV